jgi:hypothetical protein
MKQKIEMKQTNPLKGPTMYIDDRTTEQLKTHTFIVGGLDPFMSGWGESPAKSYAYWATRPEYSRNVEQWVRNNKGLKNVCVTTTKALMLKLSKKTTGKNHIHVYMVETGHPSLRQPERINHHDH